MEKQPTLESDIKFGDMFTICVTYIFKIPVKRVSKFIGLHLVLNIVPYKLQVLSNRQIFIHGRAKTHELNENKHDTPFLEKLTIQEMYV